MARQIGRGRLVDELRDDRFALGDLSAPAILGDDDQLVQRLVEQASTGSSRRAAGLAGCRIGLS